MSRIAELSVSSHASLCSEARRLTKTVRSRPSALASRIVTRRAITPLSSSRLMRRQHALYDILALTATPAAESGDSSLQPPNTRQSAPSHENGDITSLHIPQEK